jgi:hypothetical protein
MYVREYKDNDSVVISTQTSGATTGTINESCLEAYKAPVAETKPTEKPKEETRPTNTSKFAIGDAVKVIEGATWHDGDAISSWVFKSKMYVREYTKNGVVISTVKSGAVTGTINAKYLVAYDAKTAENKNFVPYIVVVNTARLNVRAEASASAKINTTIKKGEKYTIVEEKNGWGKLKSGAGWISLNYTKKV